MAIYQGTYYAKSFIIKDTDGVVQDISGWEFEADLRDRVDTEVLLTLTTANGGFVVIDGAAGRFELRITADLTVDLPKAKLVFDVLRTDASPGPVWLFAAKVPVRQPVTRDD
jgi:hypothetical protein